MLTNFEKDRQAAKEAEQIVFNFLASGLKDFTITNVSESKGCLLKGDILAECGGAQFFIEVKDDSRINETHNILFEEAVYYKWSGATQRNEIDTDIYAVVSKAENKIYFFNFRKLKKLAKFAPSRTIPHEEQTTYCKLIDLEATKRSGAYLGTGAY